MKKCWLHRLVGHRSKLDIFIETFFLFMFGCWAYMGIEMLFRGRTHWTMGILGGACFITIGFLNESINWEMPLVSQMFLGSICVTVPEFIFGVILNLILKLNIWDYSNLPYNILGQVCLIFSCAWFFLSAVAIILDDLLRWKVFGEEKPRYTFVGVRKDK